jgi:hypothetical protein
MRRGQSTSKSGLDRFPQVGTTIRNSSPATEAGRPEGRYWVGVMDRNGAPWFGLADAWGRGIGNPSQAPSRLDDDYGLIWRVVVAVGVGRLVGASGIQEVVAVRVWQVSVPASSSVVKTVIMEASTLRARTIAASTVIAPTSAAVASILRAPTMAASTAIASTSAAIAATLRAPGSAAIAATLRAPASAAIASTLRAPGSAAIASALRAPTTSAAAMASPCG